MADPALTDAPTPPYEKNRAQLKEILLAWGMPEENAETTADILSWADLHGVDSHGISMIPGYDRLRREGHANMQGTYCFCSHNLLKSADEIERVPAEIRHR